MSFWAPRISSLCKRKCIKALTDDVERYDSQPGTVAWHSMLLPSKSPSKVQRSYCLHAVERTHIFLPVDARYIATSAHSKEALYSPVLREALSIQISKKKRRALQLLAEPTMLHSSF